MRQKAEAQSRITGEETQLVLYERGRERNEFTQRILTGTIVVRLKPGADPLRIAAAHQLRYDGPSSGAKGFALFTATKTGGALRGAETLRALPEVETADPLLARLQHKRLLPNDTLFGQQWHLRNTGQSGSLAGTDVNVSSVWDTRRGTGIRIGIVDDGLQITHPDLSPNVDTVNDHDWNDATPDDPSPNVTVDFHGSSCAGVAAARGNNGIGVSGAAPEATLVGLRLIAAAETDADEAAAFGWHNEIIQVKSNSWGPSDDARTLEGPGAMGAAALAQAAQTGRGGLGTIFVWAGGNGGDVGDNSNYDGYANSIYTIAVGAVSNTGTRSFYSEPGANLIVAAPSDGGNLGIVTTDLTGNNGYNATGVTGELADTNYTNEFGGTSSAAPLVSGCIALILQANPNLGWRDVQEILIRSAKKIDASNSDWITNSAGFHFNHQYGAGLIDVQAAVTLALTWTNLAGQTTVNSAQTNLGQTIPDNNSAGVTRTFDLSASNLRVEQVTVKVNISHTSRGQLAITLTSPSGTQSRLSEKHTDPGDNYADWTFSSVRSWGENSQGTWTVKVADLTAGTTGTLNAVTVTVYGTPAVPVNQPPAISNATLNLGATAFTDQSLMVTGVTASDPEGDPISYSYEWQESTDNVVFTPIPGATSINFALTESQSGKLVRCKIVPTAAGSSGAAHFTAAVAINHRPPSFAQTGQAFNYDSDLFVASQSASFSRSLVINEFSQGNGGSKEWIELLVLKNSNLGGYTVADRLGTYTTFRSDGFWNNVPAGTLIVIYNAADRDTVLPADSLTLASGAVVASHSNSTAFTGGTWAGLSNSNAESIIVRDNTSAIVDALSLNNDNVYDPKFGSIPANTSAHYNGNSDAGADILAEWSVVAASAGNASPAAGNGGNNTQFVSDLRSGALNQVPKFRFAATNETIPGLMLNVDTGVVSGTPNVPGGGLFQVVIERYTNAETVSQTFQLLVAASDGTATIPPSKTWTLNGDVVLPGNLIVNGALDTAGHVLTVPTTLTVNGSVINTNGVVRYLDRTGNPIPGSSELLFDPAHDIADPDQDSLTNLMEFALGTDPSIPSLTGLPSVALVNGHLELTYVFPAGANGVTRTVQVSGNLSQWDAGLNFTQTISDQTINGTRTVVVRDLGNGTPRLIRLRVSR